MGVVANAHLTAGVGAPWLEFPYDARNGAAAIS